jgi:hypothetical protein
MNCIDFYSELKKELSVDSTNKEQCCLITQMPLSDNYITLECNHKFNYLPLYNEVVKQKACLNSLETTRLKINEIKCPYCRNINKKILPFIDIYGVNIVKGVNYPKHLTMKLHSCEWIFKTGKNKGICCNKPAFKTENGTYCDKHNNSLIKKTNLPNIEDYSSITKKYKISDLKNILKSLNLKVSGSKPELINRLLNVNYQFITN